METLVELLESAAQRYGEKDALGLRRDDGTTFHWSYREVQRRSRLAAWRLEQLGLEPGDRDPPQWVAAAPPPPGRLLGLVAPPPHLRAARFPDERRRDHEHRRGLRSQAPD